MRIKSLILVIFFCGNLASAEECSDKEAFGLLSLITGQLTATLGDAINLSYFVVKLKLGIKQTEEDDKKILEIFSKRESEKVELQLKLKEFADAHPECNDETIQKLVKPTKT